MLMMHLVITFDILCWHVCLRSGLHLAGNAVTVDSKGFVIPRHATAGPLTSNLHMPLIRPNTSIGHEMRKLARKQLDVTLGAMDAPAPSTWACSLRL